MNEIRENITESELCFCFLFGIRLGTALSTGYNHSLNLSESLHLASICDRAGTAWGVGTYTDEHCNFLPDTSS